MNVLDTPESIDLFGMLTLRGRLNIEIKTKMRHSGGSTLAIVNQKFDKNFKRKEKALDFLEEKILEAQKKIAIDYLLKDGDLIVPCSRWGRTTSRCAEVAWDSVLIMADELDVSPLSNSLLDELMSEVVNDNPVVVERFLRYGSREVIEKYQDELEGFNE